MRSIKFYVFLGILAFFITENIQAQKFRITGYGNQSIIFGDITKTELGNEKAGYVNQGFGSGFEMNYYLPNRLGIGFRWTGSLYNRDATNYELDLRNALQAPVTPFNLTQVGSFLSFGTSLGLSYLIPLSDEFKIEPYFYLGYRGLVSGEENAIYINNTLTYNYQKNAQLFSGFSYAPGVKLHWALGGIFGLSFFAEYEGVNFAEDIETVIISSYNELEISGRSKSYTIQALNLGLGLTLNFPRKTEN